MKKIFTLFVMSLFALSSFAELGYGVTFTQNDFNNSSTVVKKEGTIEWDNDHVRCGGSSTSISGGPAWNWDAKYFDVKLANGIPEKLSFQYAGNSGASTGVTWKVQESADGTNWTDLWSTTTNTTSFTAISKDLKVSTCYLRFSFAGNFAGKFKNIKVTEKIELGTPTPATIDFGTVKVDDAVDALTFNIGWTNLTATVSAPDAPFSATPDAFGSIGAYNKTQTVTVSLNTHTAGEYASSISISGRGKSAQVALAAVVEKHDQTINWNPAESYNWGDEIPVATATSGLDVTYVIADESVLVYENGAFRMVHGGSTQVTVSQAGNYKYNAATNVVKTITVVPPTTSATETKTITYGAQESWNGYDLSTYTVGSHELVYETTNAQGGVHTITLTLTVNKLETLNVPVSLSFCAGGSETYRGTEYTEAGIYNVPAEGATRDTVYVVNVTVLQPTFGTDTKTIVYGAQESWNGIDLSEKTVGQHEIPFTTTNAAGCDSTVTLTLTVNKIETLNVPVELSFCAGGSEIYRGTEYTEAGVYIVPAEGATRDTLYNVTVTVLQPTFGTDVKTIVYGAQESWNGIDLSEQTVGQHELEFVTANAAGCDSTVTLTLTVNKIETLNVPVELSFCAGGSETYRGTEYTEAGVYNVPAEGATRDTVYNVTVTVLQPTFGTDTKTIVYGAQETWNGIDLSEQTVGQHEIPFTTTNVAGCDSTVTLTLTVTKQNVVEIPVDFTFCAGDSAEFRGTYYKETGLFPVYVEGEVSDTVYNVAVTVNVPTFGTAEMTIVYGDAAAWNGYDLSTYMVGAYELPYNTQNVAGCDSVITLALTVNKQEALELEPVVLGFCEGDSVEYRGKWYFEYELDTIYAEGEVRDTIIYVEAVILPTTDLMILFDTVLSGHDIILPEGEWIIGEETVSGTYPTVQSGETTELVFRQYYDDSDVCGPNYIELVVTVESNFEAIDNVFYGEKAEKFFRDGVLYIRRGEGIYTPDGKRVE